jgi:hypothetical protein
MVWDVHEEDHRDCDAGKELVGGGKEQGKDGGTEQGKDGIDRDRQVRTWVSNHVWHLE